MLAVVAVAASAVAGWGNDTQVDAAVTARSTVVDNGFFSAVRTHEYGITNLTVTAFRSRYAQATYRVETAIRSKAATRDGDDASALYYELPVARSAVYVDDRAPAEANYWFRVHTNSLPGAMSNNVFAQKAVTHASNS